MTSKIIQRISREAGVENLVDLLAESLPGSDLQSLLLEVYRRRAKRRTSGELLSEHSRNRFASHSSLDPLTLLEFDRIAFGLLPEGFDRITLSPVVPWTQRLLSNRKERLASSGIGAERACQIFGSELP